MKKNLITILLALGTLLLAPGTLFAQGFGKQMSDEEVSNQNMDELGMVPAMRVEFNGDYRGAGEIEPDFAKGTLPRKPVWVKTAAYDKGALQLEDKFPTIKNLKLTDEFTLVAIMRGVDEEGQVLWCLGDAHGRGTDCLGLAANGKGGVKLITWHGKSNDARLIATRKVGYFDKQFHVYAVVRKDAEVILYVDGKRAGSVTDANVSSVPGELTFGAEFWGFGAGLKPGKGVAIDDFRLYDLALSDTQMLQLASQNQPWPDDLPPLKEAVSAFLDTNAVLRLGFELPENLVIGPDGEKKMYARGILAQCGVGAEKSFTLQKGGILAIGSDGFLFDSNYARGRHCKVSFEGGTIAAYAPSFVKSMAPIELSGRVRILSNKTLALRTSFRGDGDIYKMGTGTLGLQYPCDEATGTIHLTAGTLVLGPAASWGGAIEVGPGTVLKCVSRKLIGSVIDKGGKVLESDPARESIKDTFPQPATGYRLAQMQREKLGRGVFAFRRNENEVMVGWRYKDTDPMSLGFNVYRNGEKINAEPITDVTYCIDTWQKKACVYEVRAVTASGKEVAFRSGATWRLPATAPVGYMNIPLEPPPAGTTPHGSAYDYEPYDCSVGDLDGDGEYELVLIWWPHGAGGAGDNTAHNEMGPGYIDGMKLDGSAKRLWRICLGPNQRMGSHYIPVMVYDFDGDGKAEIVCRTSDRSVDGTGRVLGDPNAPDYRNEDKHCLFAPNYVTIFEGATGRALDSVPFKPAVLEDPAAIARRDQRAINKLWGSRNPGNQAFRFLSAVAYLDGVHPSVIMCRGYYSRTCLQALDWDGQHLKERWYFCSDDPKNWGYGGQGFHNLRVGDVDFDGKDEICYGDMVVDHDGNGLHTTGLGHGDAMHLIQASPETRGLRLWTCHEASPFGVTLRNAQTGEVYLHRNGPMDTGSCNAMDIDAKAPGVELFSGTHCGIFSASTLQQYHHPKPHPKSNYYCTLRFGIRWMGDLTTSAYSGGDTIWGYTVMGRSVFAQATLDGGMSIHSTKGCPNLQADIFGDWREEILLTGPGGRSLRLYMSPEDTKYRFHTFMEDPVYRLSVATENNGYNVPPEPGFYFGPELLGHGITFRGTKLP